MEITAEALKLIQEASKQTVPPMFHTLPVDDGGGNTLQVPLAFAAAPGGGVHLISLLQSVEEGTAFAREQRLAKADGPDRRQGTANHQTLASFCQHVNRFRDEDSVVWASQTANGSSLTAILDYHRATADGAPRWGKHRAIYPCPLSEAWQAWGGGKPMELDQEAFAAFLDTHDRELAGGTIPGSKQGPEPSDLITLSNNLETYSRSNAKRERQPNGRVQLSFSKEEGVNGLSVPVPTSFNILIPIFTDGTPEHMEVRLRTRVEQGAAMFSFNIHAAAERLAKSFEEVCAKVCIETTLPVFRGTPE